MEALRRINLSAALISLVCFFLPWVQISCSGAKDTLSGLDLARNGQTLLWLVPILLGGLALLDILRALKEKLTIYSIVSALCGAITAYLMNRERLRAHDESGLISAQLTGWFWLGLFSSVVIVISGLVLFIRGKRSPVV
jgi:predicted Co/Zn/Cd cation transporter (cation efflux family)